MSDSGNDCCWQSLSNLYPLLAWPRPVSVHSLSTSARTRPDFCLLLTCSGQAPTQALRKSLPPRLLTTGAIDYTLYIRLAPVQRRFLFESSHGHPPTSWNKHSFEFQVVRRIFLDLIVA